MPSENQAVDPTNEPVSSSAVPKSGNSRRALIRAAMLSVPVVLTLTPSASAGGGGSHDHYKS